MLLKIFKKDNPFEIRAIKDILSYRKNETEMTRILGNEHKVLKFARIFTNIEEDLRILYEVLKDRAVDTEENFTNLKHYKRGARDFFEIFHKCFLEAELIRRKNEEEDRRKKKKAEADENKNKKRKRGLFG